MVQELRRSSGTGVKSRSSRMSEMAAPTFSCNVFCYTLGSSYIYSHLLVPSQNSGRVCFDIVLPGNR